MTRHVFLTAILALLLRHPGSAQVELSRDQDPWTPASLFVEVLPYAGRDSAAARLDVFVQVGYDNLTFVKSGDTYSASYELTATLIDSAHAVVSEQDWQESITGLAFDATIAAGGSKVSSRSFTALPGRYVLALLLRDNENKAIRRLQRDVLVPAFDRPGMSLSGIMLLSRLSVEGGKTRIVPSISPNIGAIPGPLSLFLEAYNRGPAGTFTFTASILDMKDNVLVRGDTTQRCQTGRNEVFCRIDHTRLLMGDYRLVVVVTGTGSGSSLAAMARQIIVRWHGLPLGTNSLDLAIDQVRYIARGSELDSLKSAPTPEEKQRRFLEFWKRRDPNPNTPRNEKMEEYYARVEYANRHFSHYRDGWRTDMGMVYIILGPPSSVERHPFDSDSKPYEVWSYFDINQTFVFVDDSGFGEYRLTTPLWEVYRRSRDQ